MKKLLLEHKGKFAIYLAACLFPVIRNLGQIVIISLIFEIVEQNSMAFFYRVLVIAVIYLILDSVLFVVSRMMRITFMRDILLALRMKAFNKVITMSYKQFNQKSRDVYVSNLINDINTFENSFFGSLINLIFRFVLYLSTITILAFLNWPLAVIIVGVSLFVVVISKLFEKKTIALQKDVSTANEQFTVDAANMFAGLEILKLNNIEDAFLQKAKRRIGALEGKKYAFNVYSALQININGTIGYFVLMGLLVFLMFQTQVGVGYGEIMLTSQLVASTIFPLVNLLPLINTLKSSQAIFDKITKTEEIAEKSVSTTPLIFNIKSPFNKYLSPMATCRCSSRSILRWKKEKILAQRPVGEREIDANQTLIADD
ncbi:MAG: ABC transporter ATP-binding protein/permease [Bacillus subtilis]|nr:ABC transporter ATP-binding protein/permease [Bacillus subtilis]